MVQDRIDGIHTDLVPPKGIHIYISNGLFQVDFDSSDEANCECAAGRPYCAQGRRT